MPETIYLTGAAATGKSTLSRSLAHDKGCAVFEYGAEVLKRASVIHPGLTHADTRKDPKRFIDPGHIDATDDALQRFIAEFRNDRHVIIDSRPLTREPYGFRAVPFTRERLAGAGLTRVVVLTCPPEILIERRASDPDGRPELGRWEAETELNLLQSLAMSYAINCGIPIHFLDCSPSPEEVRRAFLNLLGSSSY